MTASHVSFDVKAVSERISFCSYILFIGKQQWRVYTDTRVPESLAATRAEALALKNIFGVAGAHVTVTDDT